MIRTARNHTRRRRAKMRKLTTLGILFMAWAILASAGSPMVAWGQLKPDTLIILRDIDSNNYDPHRTAARAGAEVLYMMADTLVTLDYDWKTIKPGLAKSWKVSGDGKTYTFQLRDDVKFCDGRPMTADDVVYSIKRWINPDTKGPIAWRAGPVQDVRAADKYTVEYKLKHPFSELLYQLTYFCASIVDKNAVERLGPDFGVKGFNGTGPYCWVRWEPRKDMVLKRNPHYKWGPPIYDNPGPAKVENIIWRTVPEESTRVAAMQASQADVTQYIPPWALGQLQKVPTLQVNKAKTYFWLWFIGFKIDKPSVSDPSVRRAMVGAVDQSEIAKGLYFGTVTPANTYFHPSTLDFDPEVLKLVPKYDPDLSKKLLDEAGWKMGPDGFRYKDGRKLSVLFYGNTAYQKQYETVQGFLRKVGVDFQLQLFDATVMWGKLSTQEFDAFAMSFPYFSAGDALNLYFRSQNIPTPNRMNWKDPETDRLLDEGQKALTPEARFAAYSKVQRTVHQAAVWIPLFHDDLYVASQKRVKGVKPHGNYGCSLYKGLDLEIGK
jgi:peptide/nickel transport system substrate-binding protein